MGAIKQLLEQVASTLGIEDITDQRVIEQAQLRMREMSAPKVGDRVMALFFDDPKWYHGEVEYADCCPIGECSTCSTGCPQLFGLFINNGNDGLGFLALATKYKILERCDEGKTNDRAVEQG